MLTLLQILQDRDLGFLRAVAEQWGIDLPRGTALETAAALSRAMLDRQAVVEHVEALSPATRQPLDFLISHAGRHPVADAERRFGAIRSMGPGRRDREKPWRSPASPLEDLWYRGLVGRAFAHTPSGAQEFLFIPTDLLPLLPAPRADAAPTLGHPAPIPSWSQPATLAAADDAATLLASLRRRAAKDLPLAASRAAHLARFLLQPTTADLLLAVLLEAGLISGPPYQPQPQAVRAFLDLTRLEAVRRLFLAWLASTAWNDLAHVPSLSSPSGQWPNQPRLARQTILALLRRLPPLVWWDLDSFVAALREEHPDFQRPAGDFDSWYLQDRATGAFLQGFEHWDRIEGALLRFLILGPLHALGFLDLGAASAKPTPTAFRLSQYATALLDPSASEGLGAPPSAPTTITPDGSVLVPRLAPLALRYQIARFTAWEALEPEGWRFRLTPAALQDGRRQGLQLSQMRAVLEAASQHPLPPSVLHALARYDQRGCEARLERVLLLRVASPEVLRELKRNRATARYLGADLGPTAVQVRERDLDLLRRAAARLGILLDPPDEEAGPA